MPSLKHLIFYFLLFLNVCTADVLAQVKQSKNQIDVRITTNVRHDQRGVIGGEVKDLGTGEALIGATVSFPAQKSGTLTDIDGNFSLSFRYQENIKLVFQYEGYQDKELSLKILDPRKDPNTKIIPETALDLSKINIRYADPSVKEALPNVTKQFIENIRAALVMAGSDVKTLEVQFRKDNWSPGMFEIWRTYLGWGDTIKIRLYGSALTIKDDGQTRYPDLYWKALTQRGILSAHELAKLINMQFGVVVDHPGNPNYLSYSQAELQKIYKVLLYLSAIPMSYPRSLLEMTSISSFEKHPVDRFWHGNQWAGAESETDRCLIRTSRKPLSMNTIFHEMGHFVWDKVLSVDQRTEYLNLSWNGNQHISSARFISTYAFFRPEEDFPEHFAAFFSGRADELQKKDLFPKYEFILNLLGGAQIIKRNYPQFMVQLNPGFVNDENPVISRYDLNFNVNATPTLEMIEKRNVQAIGPNNSPNELMTQMYGISTGSDLNKVDTKISFSSDFNLSLHNRQFQFKDEFLSYDWNSRKNLFTSKGYFFDFQVLQLPYRLGDITVGDNYGNYSYFSYEELKNVVPEGVTMSVDLRKLKFGYSFGGEVANINSLLRNPIPKNIALANTEIIKKDARTYHITIPNEIDLRHIEYISITVQGLINGKLVPIKNTILTKNVGNKDSRVFSLLLPVDAEVPSYRIVGLELYVADLLPSDTQHDKLLYLLKDNHFHVDVSSELNLQVPNFILRGTKDYLDEALNLNPIMVDLAGSKAGIELTKNPCRCEGQPTLNLTIRKKDFKPERFTDIGFSVNREGGQDNTIWFKTTDIKSVTNTTIRGETYVTIQLLSKDTMYFDDRGFSVDEIYFYNNNDNNVLQTIPTTDTELRVPLKIKGPNKSPGRLKN